MPTYEYACRSCGEHLEVVQSFKDEALTTCPACQGELRKVFSAAGIIFKGSGWHVKDYAGKRPATASSGGDGDGSSSGDAASGSSGSDGDGGGSTASGTASEGGRSGTEKGGSGSSGSASDGAGTSKSPSGKAEKAPKTTTSAPTKKSA